MISNWFTGFVGWPRNFGKIARVYVVYNWFLILEVNGYSPRSVLVKDVRLLARSNNGVRWVVFPLLLRFRAVGFTKWGQYRRRRMDMGLVRLHCWFSLLDTGYLCDAVKVFMVCVIDFYPKGWVPFLVMMVIGGMIFGVRCFLWGLEVSNRVMMGYWSEGDVNRVLASTLFLFELPLSYFVGMNVNSFGSEFGRYVDPWVVCAYFDVTRVFSVSYRIVNRAVDGGLS